MLLTTPPFLSRTLVYRTLVLGLLLACVTPVAAAGTTGAGFTMFRNDRFEAVATGVASGIAVEVPAGAPRSSGAARAALVHDRLDPVAQSRAAAVLRQLHALGARTPLSRVRIAVPTRNGVPAVVSPRTRLHTRGAVSTRVAPLRFVFQGFATTQQTALQSFVQRAYPLMTAVYGDPAPAQQGRVVTVVSDANAGDGIYELPAAGSAMSGGTIHIAADLPVNPPYDINNYNLTRQLLIAFHGSLIFGFDAWELGFTDAAALLVNYQAIGSPRDFDPSQLGVYLLPVYDFFNRPELGNAFFFATGTSANLGFYRAGMAQAAWLKVYVENPNFFRLFNAAYYAQAAAQNVTVTGVPLPGNTPALKRIAAGLAPTVEGLAFSDWYRRQYVLDTAITTGEKLWFGVLPEASLTSGDTRSVFFGVAQHYSTAANGDETPLGGNGVVTASDERGVDITAKSTELGQDNKVVFNTFGEAELNSQHRQGNDFTTVGFAGTGTPDQGRVTLVLRVATAEAVAYFPYNVAGTETAPAAYYGATVGTSTGRITVQPVGGVTTLGRGAFRTSGTAAYASAPRVKTAFTLTPADGGAAQVLRRNSAWASSGGRPQSLAVLLETAPGNAAFTLSLARTTTNRLRMFSLPCLPVQTDEAGVLHLNPHTLLLARYRPNLSPSTFSKNGITYGITADKHELYPNLSAPIAPGRGYWLNLTSNLTATVPGGEPSRAQPFVVPLLGGWNQVGVPYNLPFDLNAVRVQFLKATPVALATAVSNGWLAPGVWRWRPEGGYARVDTGDATNQRLQPFEGYYIFSRQARGVQLSFDARSTRASLGTLAAPLWQLSLNVTTSAGRDMDNAFGVVETVNHQPQRMPAAKPPAGTRSPTLTFLSGGTAGADSSGAGAESGWAESFVAPLPTTASWSLIIDGVTPGATTRVEWGDPRDLPEALDLTLVDETDGRRSAMINPDGVRSYNFTAGAGARKFHVEGKLLPLAVQDWSATPLPGSHSAMLAGRFGRGGSVQVTIATPGGASVRTLVEAQVVVPGTSRWLWDGRDAGHQLQPPGRYVAHVSLTDARGVSSARSISFNLP